MSNVYQSSCKHLYTILTVHTQFIEKGVFQVRSLHLRIYQQKVMHGMEVN